MISEKVAVIDGFRKRVVAYTDTDSLYIPWSSYEKLKDHGMIGEDLY